MIAPILLLFFLVVATMGRAVAIRTGPLSSGMALGLVLARTLGVSFPLFQPLGWFAPMFRKVRIELLPRFGPPGCGSRHQRQPKRRCQNRYSRLWQRAL